MDVDFLNKMGEIQSFITLQEVFESWIKEGVINEKSMELQLGYSSLIVYPSIYLTKDGAKREISAAKACHEILLKYSKDKIKQDLDSDNENSRLAATILLLPPEKYMLTVCSEFFNLHYLLVGLYSEFTDEQLTNVNGDDYAKVWLNIFSKGYHFEQVEQAINADFSHLNEALIMISKMHLSPEFKKKMDAENIKPQFNKYYHTNSNNSNSGSGCMVSIIMLVTSSLMAALLV